MVDSEVKKYGSALEYVADRCPEFGTPEHYALGGSRGPFYEPSRHIEEIIQKARRADMSE